MSFNYYMPTRFVFGCGALGKLHRREMPGKRALIVISAGKSTRTNGYLDRVTEQLEKAGVSWVVFDRILPNPVLAHVDEGAALAVQEGCDFVLGLGGGSSIDSAKAIAVKAANPEHDYWEFVGGATGGKKTPPNAPLPIVAITTTAGTGTETDPWAVITKPETKEKLGGGFDGTFPVLSVIDPELMVSVPPDLTAYQGFDALFHSIECYLHKNQSRINDLLCIDAIENIATFLPRAIRDGGDLEAREAVALGNTEAGFTQSIAGCISEHAIEHALSAYSPKLPHGAGLIAISLAYFGTLIEKGALPERFVAMAKALGKADAQVPADFLPALAALQGACGVDALRLSDFGIERADLPAIAQNAYDVMGHLFLVDPVEVVYEDTLALLEKSYR
ncbi:MAG: iron-containing alcohol dehydrogenase [Clostridiales Family XIII bacterium]|nr:iron-containing alcohol dehydrogenase [Clostridiales Family XIII bacterium]